MSYEYIERTYGVRFEVGQKVTSSDGKSSGIVVDNGNQEHRVFVRKPGLSRTMFFHPLDLNPTPEGETTS